MNIDTLYRCYRLRNRINQRSYIGITKHSLRRRRSRHIRSAIKENAPTAIARAIRKYGAEAFEIEEIALAYSHAEAVVLERALIAQYGTMVGAGGYNLTVGGDGPGKSLTTERRLKISAHLRRQWASGERRPGTNAEAVRRAYKDDPTYAERISKRRRGMEFTEDHRKNLSVVHGLAWKDPEYRAVMLKKLRQNSTGAKLKRSPQSADTIEKRRQTLIDYNKRLRGEDVEHRPIPEVCDSGHQLSPENLRMNKASFYCKLCRCEGARLRRRAKRERRRQMNEERINSNKSGGTKVALPGGPTNSHKRLAAGHTDQETNPNGVGKPSSEKKIGNASTTY